MGDLKIWISNFFFQIQETINTLRETLLRCLATFLIWFSIVMGFGIGTILTLKLMEKWLT